MGSWVRELLDGVFVVSFDVSRRDFGAGCSFIDFLELCFWFESRYVRFLENLEFFYGLFFRKCLLRIVKFMDFEI